MKIDYMLKKPILKIIIIIIIITIIKIFSNVLMAAILKMVITKAQ